MKRDRDIIFSQTSFIVDPGTYAFKAGLSGEENPSCTLESYISRPKYKKIFASEDTEIIGKASEFSGLYHAQRIFSGGMFKNTDEVKALFSKIFHEIKGSQGLKDTPVLITETLFMPLVHKVHLAKFIFETHNMPKIFFATQPVLSLFASGKTDGLVIESGDTFTQVVPVYNGYKIDCASRKTDFAGLDVTLRYKNLLAQGGTSVSHIEDLLLFDAIKKATVELQSANSSSIQRIKNSSFHYELPDGSSLQISGERFKAAEIFFEKEAGNRTWNGIADLIDECGKELDLDLKKNLYRSIYLSGGNTMIKGFPQRLAEELNGAFPGSDFKINLSNHDRSLLSWKGASLISHLSSFNQMWITKKDMEDVGERIFLSNTL